MMQMHYSQLHLSPLEEYQQRVLKLLGIPCGNRILDGANGKGALWLGCIFAAMDIRQLKNLRIKQVLTITNLNNIRYPPIDGIRHMVLSLDDSPEVNLGQHFDEIIKFIDEGLQTTNVLVHCQVGKSRSATAVIVYLMKKRNWNVQTAFNYVKQRRSIIEPNPGFMRQLEAFHANRFIQQPVFNQMFHMDAQSKQTTKPWRQDPTSESLGGFAANAIGQNNTEEEIKRERRVQIMEERFLKPLQENDKDLPNYQTNITEQLSQDDNWRSENPSSIPKAEIDDSLKNTPSLEQSKEQVASAQTQVVTTNQSSNPPDVKDTLEQTLQARKLYQPYAYGSTPQNGNQHPLPYNNLYSEKSINAERQQGTGSRQLSLNNGIGSVESTRTRNQWRILAGNNIYNMMMRPDQKNLSLRTRRYGNR